MLEASQCPRDIVELCVQSVLHQLCERLRLRTSTGTGALRRQCRINLLRFCLRCAQCVGPALASGGFTDIRFVGYQHMEFVVLTLMPLLREVLAHPEVCDTLSCVPCGVRSGFS